MFELTESWLAEQTGLPRKRLAEVRAEVLTAADWRRGQKGAIVWETSGLDRGSGTEPVLLEVLKKISCADGAEPALTGPEEEKAVVYRTFPNRRVLEAYRETGERIRVLVKDNKNFIRRMEIRVYPPSDGPNGLWRLAGRCPRWRGKY